MAHTQKLLKNTLGQIFQTRTKDKKKHIQFLISLESLRPFYFGQGFLFFLKYKLITLAI